ncbi:MAG: hypoxanthine phosphoribosyltransferase [Chloroflexota bacterium]
MAGNEQVYYKSVQQVTTALNEKTDLKTLLNMVVRNIALAMEAAASLVVRDATGKKLLHGASWGLPEWYLKKGAMDTERSMTEVLTGEPQAITDVSQDSRIQFPELTVRAGIASILGVPLIVGGAVVGAVRVYTRKRREFTSADVGFVTTMAGLAATAIHNFELEQKRQEQPPETVDAEDAIAILHQAQPVVFAHPSEAEFARILDFYRVEWAYEPRSFPLKWDGDRVTEMFTPDFYLPGFDLYVELTTLKQSLVTEKNSKLRRLRELYPEVKITLLYRKDFERLLAKYGYGPLAEARGRGVNQVLFSKMDIQQRVHELGEQVSRDYAGRRPLVIGVLRGVFCFMADLAREMTVPIDIDFMAISYYTGYTGKDGSAVKVTKDISLSVEGRDVLLVEDIVDTGMTLSYMLNHLKAKKPASLQVCALLDKRARRLVDVPLNYVGFEVGDEFLVGYGLDYQEEYRNLPFIGILEPARKTTEK